MLPLLLSIAGLLSRTSQAQAQTFEIGVTSVLTMGQLPAGLGRHAVQAYVTNNGSTTRSNLPVTLTISGVTALNNIQTVASLAPGASALVKFVDYTPATTGTNTITVTVPADANNTNNSRSASQQVTAGTFCYAGAADVPLSSRGISSNGQSAIVAAKFTAAAPVRLTSVSNFVSSFSTNVGQPLTAVVMSAAGTILARSATSTILSSDLNTRKFFTLLTPVTVTDDFLVGFLVANDQYTPLGADTELPPRSGAFYFVDHTAFGGPPSELLAGDGSTSKLYVSAVGTTVPACSNPTNLTTTAVTGTSAQLSFAPGNGNTSYFVSYAPASGGTPQTQTITSSPATLTGLQPGTAYLATVTGSCGSQTATPPAQLYFGTVPPNDQCTDPGVTTLGCGQTVAGTTFGSTSTNDPTGSFGANQIWPASGGVFYRLVGTGAPITLSMCGSSVIYDSQLFVLTGTCGSFTIVAANDDGCGADGDATMSLLTFSSVAGQNYFVYVTGYTGAQGSFSLTASCAGLPDLVVSTPQAVPGGAYRNVTVTGPATGGAGIATLTAPLNVAGTLLIQNGGTLVANCQPITGVGSFQLAAGGTLAICDATGINLTANTGAVRVTGPRAFSNDASYTYDGVSTQITGDALPSRVRNLTVDNANDLTLSSALTVSQVLRLTTGNLQTNNLPLLLPSTAAGTALVYNEGAGTVNGPATVQRYLTAGSNSGFGYRHYSAPVSNATVADLGTASFAPAVGNAYNVAAQPGLTTPFPHRVWLRPGAAGHHQQQPKQLRQRLAVPHRHRRGPASGPGLHREPAWHGAGRFCGDAQYGPHHRAHEPGHRPGGRLAIRGQPLPCTPALGFGGPHRPAGPRCRDVRVYQQLAIRRPVPGLHQRRRSRQPGAAQRPGLLRAGERGPVRRQPHLPQQPAGDGFRHPGGFPARSQRPAPPAGADAARPQRPHRPRQRVF